MTKPLSPVMQRVYRDALATGYAVGTTATIVALMNRGLIREMDPQRRHALVTDIDADHALALEIEASMSR